MFPTFRHAQVHWRARCCSVVVPNATRDFRLAKHHSFATFVAFADILLSRCCTRRKQVKEGERPSGREASPSSTRASLPRHPGAKIALCGSHEVRCAGQELCAMPPSPAPLRPDIRMRSGLKPRKICDCTSDVCDATHGHPSKNAVKFHLYSSPNRAKMDI